MGVRTELGHKIEITRGAREYSVFYDRSPLTEPYTAPEVVEIVDAEKGTSIEKGTAEWNLVEKAAQTVIRREFDEMIRVAG